MRLAAAEREVDGLKGEACRLAKERVFFIGLMEEYAFAARCAIPHETPVSISRL